jgi:nitronate monooxygenase
MPLLYVDQLDWPAEYNERALTNSFVDAWHGNEAQLSASLTDAVGAYQQAVAAENFDVAGMLVGEAVSLINDVSPAADVVRDMINGATKILNRRAGS